MGISVYCLSGVIFNEIDSKTICSISALNSSDVLYIFEDLKLGK